MNNPVGTTVQAIGDTVVGKAKAVAGEILDNDRLRADGHAQQHKGSAEQATAKRQAQAARSEAKERIRAIHEDIG